MHTLRLRGLGAYVVGPQAERFDYGGGFDVGYELRPIPYIGLEAHYRGIFLNIRSDEGEAGQYGGYHAAGINLCLHPLPDWEFADLAISAGGNLVFTGSVVRGGLTANVSLEFALTYFLRIGPFVGFGHVFQPSGGERGSEDASVLKAGLSISFLGEPDPVEIAPEEDEIPPRTAATIPSHSSRPDTDGDGVPDHADLCEDTLEDHDEFQDLDGCPDPDNDRDGINDIDDACPTTPETVNGFEDTDGCPDIISDRDEDGIADHADHCPRQPEDLDGFSDEDGCPERDNDGDGFDDGDDACPNRAETRNDFEDEDGCPDERPSLRALRELSARIYFPHDRVRPTSASMPILWRVARLINRNPEWRLVRVEGHTSQSGTDEYNHNLSYRRARRIMDRLIGFGVDRERLEAIAYGETHPEQHVHEEHPDDGEAHAPNRRVVFVVMVRNDSAQSR